MLRIVELNVATPFEATAEAPEAMVPGPVATLRLMVSAWPVFEPVSTLPNVSSTEAAKEVKAVPAVPVVGGAVLKTTLEGVVGAITVGGEEVAVVSDREVSVAVRV